MQGSLWTMRQNNHHRDGRRGVRRTLQAESATDTRSKSGDGSHRWVLDPGAQIKSLHCA